MTDGGRCRTGRATTASEHGRNKFRRLHAGCGRNEPRHWPAKFAAAGVDLDQCVKDALESSGLLPKRLELKVAEVALLRDIEGATKTLALLRELGVCPSIVDFGATCAKLAKAVGTMLDPFDVSFRTPLAEPASLKNRSK